MKDELNRIESLGESGDIKELTELLAHEDWQVRRATVDAIVARALGSEPGALSAVLDNLLHSLYSEANAGLRNSAQEALTRLAPHSAQRFIVEIGKADTDVRILLAPVLGETGSLEVVPTLLELTRSDDINIATAAVIGLGRLRRREAVDPLLDLVKGDNLWLSFPAVEALGVLGDSRGVPLLAERLGDPLLAASALDSLVKIGDSGAARSLARHLFAAEPMRSETLEALVRITQEDWPPPLGEAVRNSVIDAFRIEYRGARFDELVELTKAGSARMEAAIEALGWSGDHRALPVLLVALGRPATEASAAAGLAILLSDPRIAAELDHYSGHLSAPVREELARVLAIASPLEAANLLVDLLVDEGHEEIQLDAVDLATEVADQLGSGRPVDDERAGEIARRLAADMPRVPPEARAPLARLLKQLAAAAHLDPGPLSALAAEMVGHPEVQVRLAGAELSAAWGGLTDRAREALHSALHDQDPMVRVRAVEVAAGTKAPELRGLFATSLADEEPLVRRAAVGALAEYKDEESARALHSALNDWHGLVAADALAALADRGDVLGEEALLDASRSERAMLRCIAADRLAALSSEQARRRVLEMASGDQDPEVRRAAVAAFCGLGSAEARAAVDPALADAHHAVRHAGLRLAAEYRDESLAQKIATIADTDESADVRGEALVSLAACCTDPALERVGRCMLDPAVAPYALRALATIAAFNPERLRRYRAEEAPPRAAFAIDALFSGSRA